MNLNNPSAPPRHEATEDNDQPPKYEDIFGERDEIAIEIPSQNENPQIQIQQARMVQVTIGRPMMPSQTGNQQIASGQKILKKVRRNTLNNFQRLFFKNFNKIAKICVNNEKIPSF